MVCGTSILSMAQNRNKEAHKKIVSARGLGSKKKE